MVWHAVLDSSPATTGQRRKRALLWSGCPAADVVLHAETTFLKIVSSLWSRCAATGVALPSENRVLTKIKHKNDKSNKNNKIDKNNKNNKNNCKLDVALYFHLSQIAM